MKKLVIKHVLFAIGYVCFIFNLWHHAHWTVGLLGITVTLRIWAADFTCDLDKLEKTL